MEALEDFFRRGSTDAGPSPGQDILRVKVGEGADEGENTGGR